MFLPTKGTNRRRFLERSVLGAGSILLAPLLLEGCTDHLITPPSTPITMPPAAENSITWYDQIKSALTTGLEGKPVAGAFPGALVNTLWPSSGEDVWEQIRAQIEALVGQQINDDTYNNAKSELDALNGLVGKYLNEIKDGTPDQINKKWEDVTGYFVKGQASFTVPGYEVLLLPFFAQFATLYLGLLRDGVAFGQSWGRSDDEHQQDIATLQGYIQGATQQHVTGWYTVGRTAVVNKMAAYDNFSAPFIYLGEPFRSVNKYDREMTLWVLDFMNIWPYFDVTQYPNGANVVLTREIYSDPYGSSDESSAIVLPLPSPPTQFPTEIWVFGGLQIDAVQLTYPAGSGPGGLTQTARMGDQSGGANYPPGGAVLTLSPDNPITQFRVVYFTDGSRQQYGPYVFAIQFQFYDGTPTNLLGGLSLYPGWETFPIYADTGWVGFGPYEALSSIFINGANTKLGTAGRMVFGFKHWQPPK